MVVFLIRAQSGKPVSITAIPAAEDTVGQIVPLIVTIKDSSAIGVPDVPVEFMITEDGYNAKIIGNPKKITDSNGEAKVNFRLGEKVGDYTVRARSDSLPGKWIDIHINAVHDKADSLKIHSGNKQYMEKGQWLNDPVVVMVTDRFGNPVEDKDIFFSTSENSVKPTHDTTNVQGLAECYWKIGTKNSNELYALPYSGNLHPNAISFTAYGVDNHFPNFDGLPTEITLDYTAFYQNDSTFTKHIEATDADGEPITYTVLDIPASAKYDINTHEFSWKPGSPNDKGIWTLRIKAEDNVQDNAHGVRTFTLKFKVIGNMPPSVSPVAPSIDSTVRIDSLDCIEFSVRATDLDNDPLTYIWEIDSVQQPSSGPKFTVCSKDWPDIHHLRCYVSDGLHEVPSDEWIIDKVELSGFSATAEPYKGIIIDWSTASESSNLGFNILRSLRKNGVYKKLNTKIIPSKKDGSYSYSDTSAAAGVKYYYKLEDVSTNGYRSEHGPISVQVSAPDHFALLQNYPNPFNPQTSIRFQLPQPAETKLIIFNYLGQEVRTLVKAKMKAGYHEIIWDGRNDAGLRVSSGIYYYRIISGDFKATKKMVLIK
ncbi:MAG: T9SS type A sorting domain-containing protein [Calditrichaeota bacterium]|nr:T9SS type A sorting domain-containing protein [Calditrichota bacterium]